MKGYIDINETEMILLTLAHMLRNLKQLYFENFKLRCKVLSYEKTPQ